MANEIILIIFYVVILLYTVIIHEVMHGVVAMWLGDATAKYAGRVTANPFRHIDPWLTLGMPLLMLMLTGGRFAFGSAKPVPYNPYNLKNQKWGPALVALAGPGSNIIIAVAAAIIANLISIPMSAKKDIILTFKYADWVALSQIIANSLGSIFFILMVMIVFWNVFLAFFNLIPIPPLDGSKLLFAVTNIRVETMAVLEQFGFIILIACIVLFSGPLGAFLNYMLNLFLGITV
jgi:Zn-dependent protease